MTTISDWQRQVHQNSRDHGWWDGIPEKDPGVIPEKIALIHSEVSEALECYRNADVLEEAGFDLLDPIYDSGDGDVSEIRFPYADDGDTLDETKPRKPVGMDSELADIMIRVMDLSEHLGIDLERAIREKHEFNKTRPQRHGGKRC